MTALGFRCGKDELVYVILEGELAAPNLVGHDKVSFPSQDRPAQLVWLRKEVHEIVQRTRPASVAFKAPEGNAKTKDLGRAEVEGVLQEAAAAVGYEPIRRVWSQIKSDVAFPGLAKDLPALLDVPTLGGLPKNRAEAALAALAALARA